MSHGKTYDAIFGNGVIVVVNGAKKKSMGVRLNREID